MPDYKAFSDEKLLSLSAIDRNDKAANELLIRYEDELWRFIRRRFNVSGPFNPKSYIEAPQGMSSNFLDAQELFQDLWLRICRLENYQDDYKANCKAYVYKTARNLLRDRGRTIKAHNELLKSEKGAKELLGAVKAESSSFIGSQEDTYKVLHATGQTSVTTPLPANISASSANRDSAGGIGVDKTEDGEVVHIPIDVAPGPDASIEQRHSEEWRQFIECWDKLSEAKQEVIMMARLEGKLTYKQMAEVLEEKFEAVKRRLRDGVRELTECMGDLLTVTAQGRS